MRRFLFDRLCDPCPKTPLDEEQRINWMKASIREELQRIVSNRAYFYGIGDSQYQQRTVLNFGINDLLSYGSNTLSLAKLTAQVIDVIATYEPRLHNVKVSIKHDGSGYRSWKMGIVGDIKLDDTTIADSELVMEVTGG